jgi:hypothetical protein
MERMKVKPLTPKEVEDVLTYLKSTGAATRPAKKSGD